VLSLETGKVASKYCISVAVAKLLPSAKLVAGKNKIMKINSASLEKK
jgi:hypothetical protein